MATINKEIAVALIDGNGHYAGDPQVKAVIHYRSALSRHWEWAVIFPVDDINRYAPSEYVKDPKFLWANEQYRNRVLRHPNGCTSCKQPFTSANVRGDMAWRETQISGLCENCWDKVFAEKED